LERILVIYDDPALQRTVGRILKQAGYDVITARSGPDAIDVFHETNPGLVVLDLCEQGKSGQDLCREIRANSDVPLLVSGAVGDLADVVELLEIEADGFITKPISPGELLGRVRTAMRRLIC
jgi:DNA-binding response OmpR family regulator